MKKRLILTIALILIGFGCMAYAVDRSARSGNAEDKLVVKNWKGERVGSVQHVLTNSSSGKIVFVILSLEKEKKEIVIPLDAFSSYDQENGTLVLSVSKKILIAAPEFHLSDLKDPSFPERVSRFFGEAPSWTDGAKQGEMML